MRGACRLGGMIGGVVLALVFGLAGGEKAEAVGVFQSLTVDRLSIIAGAQDVQTARLVVSTTQPELIDGAEIRVNFPQSGRPNSVSYPSGRGETNFRGYFAWNPAEGFRERGFENYGASTVNLLPENTVSSSLGSERIVDTAAGTVTFVFRWTANVAYDNIPDNDIWYYFAESSTGYRSWWNKVETNFAVASPGYSRPSVATFAVSRASMLANNQDVQTVSLTVSTTNPALLDTARLTINYPWSSQPVNPPSGYFQWTSRYSFGEVGGENQFGNQLVRLLPVNALNPGLGSERIVNAASSTVTFNFRFVADPTFGDKINNDVWFYLSESSTGYVRPWDTVEGTVFNVIANYTPPTVSVSLHPNSLAARLYAAGTVGARLADFQFTVTSTEGVEINSLHFTQNTVNTASSSFMDYNLVYLTDISGNTVYGASVPTSTSVTINIAPGSVIVTSSLRLTLRADLSAIAANANVTVGGHRLGYSISDARHVTARGVLFNQPASVTLGQPLPNGDTHIMYKATPTVSSLTVSTTLTQGADLFKVRVSASGGDVSLYKFTFDIAPSGTQVIGLDFVDITDPNNESVLAQNAINQTGALFAAEVYFSNFGQEATVVPNHARTFVLRGTFANLSTGDTVSTRLAGDAAPTMLYALMLPAATVDLDPNDDFIWSDRHAFMTPHSTASDDWTNGYLVQGLPATQSQARTLTAL